MSLPLPLRPMLKCARSAADVEWVRVRAREMVRVREGLEAEMWIAVLGFAREDLESVRWLVWMRGHVLWHQGMSKGGFVTYQREVSGHRRLVQGRFLVLGR